MTPRNTTIFPFFFLILLLSSCHQKGQAQESQQYFLDKSPFISPKIIQDLSTWISDGGDQVIAINLSESQGSNRYFGNFLTRNIGGNYPYVYLPDTNKNPQFRNEFGFQFQGKTVNGISVIYTRDQEGGSFTSRNLMLLRIIDDTGISISDSTLSESDSAVRLIGVIKKSPRIVLQKILEIGVASDWNIKIEGNKLTITDVYGPKDKETEVIDLSQI